jgi:hypothetical protein
MRWEVKETFNPYDKSAKMIVAWKIAAHLQPKEGIVDTDSIN